MIFQYTIGQILHQEKTQTRRIIKADELAVRALHNKIVAVVAKGRVKWQIGNTYAVQSARGKPSVARIRITQINSEHVTRIGTRDAIAEGFSSRQEFLRVWQQIHGPGSLGVRVWVLTFELVAIAVDARLFATVPTEKTITYAR